MKGGILVIGAREGSLGHAVDRELSLQGYKVDTAGISDEDMVLDVTKDSYVGKVFRGGRYAPYRAVVYTAGINWPGNVESYQLIDDDERDMHEHFDVNVVGFVRVLQHWLQHLPSGDRGSVPNPLHCVAVSSNSARIARTRSLAYCASKAALSMAVRVAARELAGKVVVYGYEPGLLADTPMTQQVRKALNNLGAYNTEEHSVAGNVVLHRMPGVASVGLNVRDVARVIAYNLRAGDELNGCLIPVDAGEQ